MKGKLYFLEASRRYNHGCTDCAVYRDNGDGTVTCIDVNNCTSCWQVGHDKDHMYAKIGEVIDLEDLMNDPDWEPTVEDD